MNSFLVSYLVFSLDENRYACQSSYVQRIFRAIEITEVPNSEKNILGIINLHGQIIPVIDIRQILGIHTQKNIDPDDNIVVIGTEELNQSAMVVNSVNYIEAKKEKIVKVDEAFSIKKDFLEDILKDPNGPIYILNMNNIIGQVKQC